MDPLFDVIRCHIGNSQFPMQTLESLSKAPSISMTHVSDSIFMLSPMSS